MTSRNDRGRFSLRRSSEKILLLHNHRNALIRVLIVIVNNALSSKAASTGGQCVPLERAKHGQKPLGAQHFRFIPEKNGESDLLYIYHNSLANICYAK